MEKLKYGEPSRNGVRPIVWSKKQLAFIRYQYEENGMSLRAIAAHFGLPTHSRITLICNEMGWTRSKRNSERAQFRQQMLRRCKKYVRLYLKPRYSAQMVARVISADAGIQYKGDYSQVLNTYLRSQGLQKDASEVNGSKIRLHNNLHKSRLLISHYLKQEPKSFAEYKYIVNHIAKITVPRWVKLMGWEKKVKQHDMSIDHIYSTYHGYYDFNFNRRNTYVSFDIICHPCNIQIISKLKNSTKLNLCEITLKELKNRIRQFNAEHGDPFKLETEDGKI